ncbi:DUF192 domain-containing protein [Labrys monachus]|uniref:Uncharacterized membrane protein (UPF0127 family) n=1 Tax=Labrys monachus TaxID=217067 RepID=A0ABU0FEM7_9HYPH|nr:DUF192 domain-containing protein [Labrys monachus]MDQ0393073.1 uncharacterized membrane protein (UPF0127 family) [Labrys monachus]
MSTRHPLAAAFSALFAALFLLLAGLPGLAEEGVFEPLSITTQSGKHDFQVEVMRTDEEQQRGMMFRRSLADDKGMLFPFKDVQVATFWMENTYVSLDMIFIRADGTVQRIEKRAEPLSTRTISSGAPVLAVLEVVAGSADRLGVKPGDKVSYPLFKTQ